MGTTVKSQQDKSVLVFGVGYTARAIISHLQARGYDMYGTTRDAITAIEMKKDGVNPIMFDGDVSEDLLHVITEADIILSSIPPGKSGDPVLSAFPNLGDQARKCRWAGYLSATSVYGDRGGQWAYENELLHPSTARGRRRVEAEITWLESGLPVHVFRLAGIYGPGRNPFEKIRTNQAQAVIKSAHVVNRIHVDDIASAVLASIDTPDPVSIYNLADDKPAPPQNVLDFAADLIGEPRPPHVDLEKAEMSDMARSFYQDNKRVSNARAKEMLGWSPLYPNYQTGLMATLRTETKHANLVMLSGHINVPLDKVQVIKAALSDHIKLTRAEPGCERFEVWQDDLDPKILHVFETFDSPESFRAHQNRIQDSPWLEITRDAVRHYDIIGL